ncbi:glycosyltransferase [Streptomyces chiangmaiensis]|uniref:D-inositol 3-phosphate glycosyltransferase n=1 Tax=Streptomyces chiangmaiensis TaxID=766497 RepID=A0ABU7FLI6_9ACTN|nr:glycosyltransferase [Streptomyces chiangmaiensis]MED7824253.1 glycosyltransferase [Streptomyces chiangmaiensis]
MSSGLARAGAPALGARLLNVLAHRIPGRRLKADLLVEAAELELSRGLTPRRLKAAYAAELACADMLLKEGNKAAATASAAKALMLAFHRVPHLDGLTSPLAEDPQGFTAALQRSRVMRLMAKPRGRTAPAAPPPDGRPLRLLVVNRANANFLPIITDWYERHPDVEVRTLDLAADPDLASLAKGLGRMMARAVGGQAAYGRAAEQALRPYLDWADTVFVDWCSAGAAFLTLVDPGTTRVVVRLHSFEAFSYWPHVMDFSRVDDLLFVGAHVRDLTTAAVPRLLAEDAPRLSVIHNAMDLSSYRRPKHSDARFTLGLVGVGQVAKDPRWAVEVLRLLRKQDDRYRLLLVGDDLNTEISPAVGRYRGRLEQDLAKLEASGAVRHIGQTDDVPAALEEVGTILSTSVRESFHCALVEGAASGAVPVVRDWPFFANGDNGARTLFPQEWVVGTPEEAARRILGVTATEETWLKAGHAASEHALSAWDWTVVRDDFDRLFLGGQRNQ